MHVYHNTNIVFCYYSCCMSFPCVPQICLHSKGRLVDTITQVTPVGQKILSEIYRWTKLRENLACVSIRLKSNIIYKYILLCSLSPFQEIFLQCQKSFTYSLISGIKTFHLNISSVWEDHVTGSQVRGMNGYRY